jgi:hypothetical protein
MRSIFFKASFVKRSIARVLVAFAFTGAFTGALAGSLLSTLVPLSTASSTKLCTMACCAGKAPHLAGSCMHDACESPLPQVALRVSGRKEHLCGEEVLSGAKPVVKRKLPTRSARKASESSHAVTSVRKPCPPDCGAAICSSTNQRRQRDLLAPALVEQPQPPPQVLFVIHHSPLAARAGRRLTGPARAPPIQLT